MWWETEQKVLNWLHFCDKLTEEQDMFPVCKYNKSNLAQYW